MRSCLGEKFDAAQTASLAIGRGGIGAGGFAVALSNALE
jgi:hypothetical protein